MNFPTYPLRVYLAGKVGKNDWRHQVVPQMSGSDEEDYKSWVRGGWKPLKTIFENVVCTGPFFTSCDHGCAHGGIEGEPDIGCHGVREFPVCACPCPRDLVVQWCREGISAADLFYAWLGPDGPLDDCTAYGTLVELGYAKGSLTGTKTITAAPSHDSDLWFAHHLADHAVLANDPMTGLVRALSHAKTFWRARV